MKVISSIWILLFLLHVTLGGSPCTSSSECPGLSDDSDETHCCNFECCAGNQDQSPGLVIGFMVGIMFCVLFISACGSYMCKGRGKPKPAINKVDDDEDQRQIVVDVTEEKTEE